jgi:hypothetical protein
MSSSILQYSINRASLKAKMSAITIAITLKSETFWCADNYFPIETSANNVKWISPVVKQNVF